MKDARAAYIHIPFCSQICYYCDFPKFFLQGQPVEAYLEALISEFRNYEIGKLKTLYIGGGTPTTLSPAQMSNLIKHLTESLDLEQLEEFTVEANPGDLSDEMISVLADSPVNRISLGVQTFNDQLLKKIGRGHSSKDVYQSLEKLKKADFENISLDLIYGLPKQTLEQVVKDLDRLLALEMPHVALYSLILEDHTRFMNMQRKGILHLPSEDRNADMYEYIVDRLLKQGYAHYEVSNFSKPGFESKHNLTYWNNESYYGIGAGASGYLEGIRYKNHGPIHHYLEAGPNKRVNEEKLSKREQVEEEMFLGLRKAEGVSLAKFEEKFSLKLETVYAEALSSLSATDLIKLDQEKISLTERGFELGNEVFEKFLLVDEEV